jgi:hypothetical protein
MPERGLERSSGAAVSPDLSGPSAVDPSKITGRVSTLTEPADFLMVTSESARCGSDGIVSVASAICNLVLGARDLSWPL